MKRLTADAVPVQSIIIVVIIGLTFISLGIIVQIIRRKVY